MNVRLSAATLLQLPIRVGDRQLGWPVDLVVDLRSARVLGLEVRSTDGRLCFLPFAAGRVAPGEIAVASALMLLGERDAAFYRTRGRSVRSLRSLPVTRAGGRLGVLVDVVVDADGSLAELVVETVAGEELVPFAPDIDIVDPRRSAA